MRPETEGGRSGRTTFVIVTGVLDNEGDLRLCRKGKNCLNIGNGLDFDVARGDTALLASSNRRERIVGSIVVQFALISSRL